MAPPLPGPGSEWASWVQTQTGALHICSSLQFSLPCPFMPGYSPGKFLKLHISHLPQVLEIRENVWRAEFHGGLVYVIQTPGNNYVCVLIPTHISTAANSAQLNSRLCLPAQTGSPAAAPVLLPRLRDAYQAFDILCVLLFSLWEDKCLCSTAIKVSSSLPTELKRWSKYLTETKEQQN